MKRADECSYAELIDLVNRIQQRMYVDSTSYDEDCLHETEKKAGLEPGQHYWSPDKEWDSPEDLSYVAELLDEHGLVPKGPEVLEEEFLKE